MVVVNYAQLRVCGETLNQIKWLTVILDEGQQIKNPDSKAAKAAREIVSYNRLVLSGTPIENRLLDMWSLMAFSMPGVLGSRSYFKKRFDKRKDPQSQNRLAARLKPFLLRRTKSQVAKDLPPRTEEEVYAKMEGIQSQLYKAELRRIQQALLGLDSDESVKKNSFAILQGLMRLRQICCHRPGGSQIRQGRQCQNDSPLLPAGPAPGRRAQSARLLPVRFHAGNHQEQAGSGKQAA